jgi:hypothetical protein
VEIGREIEKIDGKNMKKEKKVEVSVDKIIEVRGK